MVEIHDDHRKEKLKQKIATANDLRSLITTMKALAAVTIYQYEKAIESLSEYASKR